MEIVSLLFRYCHFFDRNKSIPGVENYLRSGVSLTKLDIYARQKSDNEFAERMVKARSNLFKQAQIIQQRLTFFDPNQLPSGSLFD